MNVVEQTIQGISAYRYKTTPNLETGISYVVSINKETNRQPDEYFFWVGEDGLVDPKTCDYLHNLITPDSHHNPYLGLVEYSMLRQLDSWSTKNSSRLSVWISPELRAEKEYPDNKIILHEVAETPSGQKKVNNIMIIFECSRNECLRIAKQLFPTKTKDVNTPEELRCMLIDIGNDLSIADIINTISPYIPKNEKYESMRDEDKRYLGGLISQGVSSHFFAQEMLRLGAIGEHSLLCVGGSGTYTALINSNSLILNFSTEGGKFVRNCGKCGKAINAYISKGYRCSCGGIYEGC